MIILTQWPDSIISYKRSVQGITKECCFILPTFAGSRHEKEQKSGFTHVQLLSCTYFQWYTLMTFTNNMRSNEIHRKEIIKGFPRSAHIKLKHNKATGSTETHVTEKGIP